VATHKAAAPSIDSALLLLLSAVTRGRLSRQARRKRLLEVHIQASKRDRRSGHGVTSQAEAASSVRRLIIYWALRVSAGESAPTPGVPFVAPRPGGRK